MWGLLSDLVMRRLMVHAKYHNTWRVIFAIVSNCIAKLIGGRCGFSSTLPGRNSAIRRTPKHFPNSKIVKGLSLYPVALKHQGPLSQPGFRKDWA
jgi:hypothetical protein